MWQVWGQEQAVAFLERSLRQGYLSHAYLFVGPKQVGKGTLALELAKAINCQGPEAPCGECRSCRRIAAGNCADVTFIAPGEASGNGAKTQIGIDQVRELQRWAALEPFEGKRRVFIIDGAESLSAEASDALLKVLEEPPAAVLLILLTADEESLTPTIRSRCQRVEVRPLPPGAIEGILTRNYGVDEERGRLLARLSRGRLGWALAARANDSLLRERSEEIHRFLALAESSIEERFSFASALAARFASSREQVFETLSLWLDIWRDLLLIRAGLGPQTTTAAHEKAVVRVASRYSISQLKGFMDSLLAARQELEDNANPRLALEVLMLRLAPAQGREERGREAGPSAPAVGRRTVPYTYEPSRGNPLQEGGGSSILRPRQPRAKDQRSGGGRGA